MSIEKAGFSGQFRLHPPHKNHTQRPFKIPNVPSIKYSLLNSKTQHWFSHICKTLVCVYLSLILEHWIKKQTQNEVKIQHQLVSKLEKYIIF